MSDGWYRRSNVVPPTQHFKITKAAGSYRPPAHCSNGRMVTKRVLTRGGSCSLRPDPPVYNLLDDYDTVVAGIWL
jgi:hypothetical protein